MRTLVALLIWAARMAALLLLESVFGVAFYFSAIAGSMAGAEIGWNLPDWQFLRTQVGKYVMIATTLLGAILGGCGWLALRYRVIQPALRRIGLSKRSETHKSESTDSRPGALLCA